MNVVSFPRKPAWTETQVRECLAGRDARRVRHWYTQAAAHLADLPGATKNDLAALRAIADELLERLGVVP